MAGNPLRDVGSRIWWVGPCGGGGGDVSGARQAAEGPPSDQWTVQEPAADSGTADFHS